MTRYYLNQKLFWKKKNKINNNIEYGILKINYKIYLG